MTQSASRKFKDDTYREFAKLAKGLASATRLELLDLLCQAPRTVEALADLAGQSVANSSQHLQILRATGLVEAERAGRHIRYRAAEGVCELFHSLRELAQIRLPEIRRVTEEFLADRGGMEHVALDELVGRVRRGEVTVIDVRPREEYLAGHIPGAVSVPLETLEARLGDFPKDRDLVAYCRGPYCVLAVEAVQRLAAFGFNAVRLEDGVAEWRARGFAVVTEEE